jgi:hypothetical protein
MENNKGKAGVTIILVILVLALAGYISYDKFYSKKEVDVTTTTTTTTKVVNENDFYKVDLEALSPNQQQITKDLNDLTLGGKTYKVKVSMFNNNGNQDDDYLLIGDKKFTSTNEKYNFSNVRVIAVMDNNYLILGSDLDVNKFMIYDSNFNLKESVGNTSTGFVAATDGTNLKLADSLINKNTLIYYECTGSGEGNETLTINMISFYNKTYTKTVINTVYHTLCSAQG